MRILFQKSEDGSGEIVALPKEVLEKHIPGPHPKPEGFVDAPANGYPEIDRKYFR